MVSSRGGDASNDLYEDNVVVKNKEEKVSRGGAKLAVYNSNHVNGGRQYKWVLVQWYAPTIVDIAIVGTTMIARVH
jgi:hypothetical protein